MSIQRTFKIETEESVQQILSLFMEKVSDDFDVNTYITTYPNGKSITRYYTQHKDLYYVVSSANINSIRDNAFDYGFGFFPTVDLMFDITIGGGLPEYWDVAYYEIVSTMLKLAHEKDWNMAFFSFNEVIGLIRLNGSYKIDKKEGYLATDKYLSIIKELKDPYEIVESLNT